MKMVIAYVKSVMAAAVVDALHAIPELTGATLTKVQGYPEAVSAPPGGPPTPGSRRSSSRGDSS